jgi:hypothetical protein
MAKQQRKITQNERSIINKHQIIATLHHEGIKGMGITRVHRLRMAG